MIEKQGLAVQHITKKLGEGHPNVVDVIQDGLVHGVVNTITSGGAPLRDGFSIRRAATEKGIPCFTSLDTFRAAVEGLVGRGGAFTVQPMTAYLGR